MQFYILGILPGMEESSSHPCCLCGAGKGTFLYPEPFCTQHLSLHDAPQISAIATALIVMVIMNYHNFIANPWFGLLKCLQREDPSVNSAFNSVFQTVWNFFLHHFIESH